MKNPYKIFNVSINVNKHEIKRAELNAMREKKHSLQEISNARNQLMTPSKRLCADFMFPSKIKAKRPKLISIETTPKNVDLSMVNINSFDFLK